MITSENESYACVLVGRAKRQGSGVASEAGVSTEQNILKIVTEKHKSGPWRVKKFRGSHSAPAGRMMRGVSGVLTEAVFFFYRGRWPSNIVPGRRNFLGGTTWDDSWNDVPEASPENSNAPYVVKQLIFEDCWSSKTKEEKGEEGAEPEDDEGEDQGKKGEKKEEKKKGEKKDKKDDKKKRGKKGENKEEKKEEKKGEEGGDERGEEGA